MSQEPWKPRPNDDLVEPLFGGLRGQAEEGPRGSKKAGLIVAWLAGARAVGCLLAAALAS